MSEITLTTAELELIEARRAEEAATADRKAAEESARLAKIDEAKTRRDNRIASMIDALDNVDDDNLTFQTEKGGDLKVYFLLDGSEEEITIEEHRVTSSTGWSARSAGIKYKLWGNFNNYSNRYYTNPKTIIKKIVELQTIVANRKASATASKDLSERALDALTAKYPDADVVYKKGYDYRGNRNRYSPGNYQPDHITVTTPNGTVEFTYSNDTPTPGVNDEGVKFSIRARRPSQDISDQIVNLILG